MFMSITRLIPSGHRLRSGRRQCGPTLTWRTWTWSARSLPRWSPPLFVVAHPTQDVRGFDKTMRPWHAYQGLVIFIKNLSILGPMPPYETGSSGQDTVQAGTFWGVLNVSLRASGTQLRLDLTCFVIRHPSWKKIGWWQNVTQRRHISIVKSWFHSWGFMGFSWFQVGSHGFSWFQLDFYGFSWFQVSFSWFHKNNLKKKIEKLGKVEKNWRKIEKIEEKLEKNGRSWEKLEKSLNNWRKEIEKMGKGWRKNLKKTKKLKEIEKKDW